MAGIDGYQDDNFAADENDESFQAADLSADEIDTGQVEDEVAPEFRGPDYAHPPSAQPRLFGLQPSSPVQEPVFKYSKATSKPFDIGILGKKARQPPEVQTKVTSGRDVEPSISIGEIQPRPQSEPRLPESASEDDDAGDRHFPTITADTENALGAQSANIMPNPTSKSLPFNNAPKKPLKSASIRPGKKGMVTRHNSNKAVEFGAVERIITEMVPGSRALIGRQERSPPLGQAAPFADVHTSMLEAQRAVNQSTNSNSREEEDDLGNADDIQLSIDEEREILNDETTVMADETISTTGWPNDHLPPLAKGSTSRNQPTREKHDQMDHQSAHSLLSVATIEANHPFDGGHRYMMETVPQQEAVFGNGAGESQLTVAHNQRTRSTTQPFPESATPSRSRRSQARPKEASPFNNRPIRPFDRNTNESLAPRSTSQHGGVRKPKAVARPKERNMRLGAVPKIQSRELSTSFPDTVQHAISGDGLNAAAIVTHSAAAEISNSNYPALAFLDKIMTSKDVENAKEVQVLMGEIARLQTEVRTLQENVTGLKTAKETSQAKMSQKVDKMKAHFAKLAKFNRDVGVYISEEKGRLAKWRKEAEIFDEASNMISALQDDQANMSIEIEELKTKAEKDVVELNAAHSQELEKKLHALQAEKLKVSQLETTIDNEKKHIEKLRGQLRAAESDAVDATLDKRDDAIMRKIDGQSEYLLNSIESRDEVRAAALLESIEALELQPNPDPSLVESLAGLKQLMKKLSGEVTNALSQKEESKDILLQTGNRLLDAIEAKVNSISDNTGRHAQLASQILELQNAKANLELCANQQENEITKLEEKLATKDQLIADKQMLLDQRCSELAQVQTELQQSAERIASLQEAERSLEETTRQNQKLVESHTKLSDDLKELAGSNKLTVDELGRAQQELRSCQEAWRERSEVVQALETEKTSALTRAQFAEDSLENTRKALNQQRDNIAQEVEKQRVKIEEEKRLAIKQEQLLNGQKISGHKRRIEDLQSDLDKSKSIEAELQKRVASLTSANTELSMKLAKQTDEASQRQLDLAPLQASLIAQQYDISTLEQSVESHRSIASISSGIVTDLLILVDRLVKECDHQHTEVERYRTFESKLKIYCAHRALRFEDVDFDGFIGRLTASISQDLQKAATRMPETMVATEESDKAVHDLPRRDAFDADIQVPASPLVEDSQLGALKARDEEIVVTRSPFNLPKAKRNARIAVRRRSSILQTSSLPAPPIAPRGRSKTDISAQQLPSSTDARKNTSYLSRSENTKKRMEAAQEPSSEDIISYMTPVKKHAKAPVVEPGSTPLTDLDEVIDMMFKEPAEDPIAVLEQHRRERTASNQMPHTKEASEEPGTTAGKKTLKRPNQSRPLKGILKKTTLAVAVHTEDETSSKTTTATMASVVPERQLLQPPKFKRSLSSVGMGFLSSQEAIGGKVSPKREPRDNAVTAADVQSGTPRSVSAPNVSVPRSQNRKRTSLSGTSSMETPTSAAKRPRMSIPYSQKPAPRATPLQRD